MRTLSQLMEVARAVADGTRLPTAEVKRFMTDFAFAITAATVSPVDELPPNPTPVTVEPSSNGGCYIGPDANRYYNRDEALALVARIQAVLL